MKKLFFASAIALGALCSCSNDEVVASAAENGIGEETGLVPVQLTLNRPSIVASVRGVGMVGGTQVDENKWNGEDLYVFMMCKQDDAGNPKFEYSEWEYRNADNISEFKRNFENAKLAAPTDVTTGDLYSNAVEAYNENEPKFYPMNRSLHDFFAYHIDDAYEGAATGTAPTYNKEDDRIVVPFVIDGSQDLMAGKALPGEDADDPALAYSAQSARAGVIPNIKMKHLLSRFTFEVKGGDSNANGLVVNSITVTSKTTGQLIAAYSPSLLTGGAEVLDPTQLLTFDEEEKDLVLKQKDAEGGSKLVDLTPLALVVDGSEGQVHPIGESLMVAPGSDSYTLKVTTTQTMGALQNTFTHSADIKVPGGAMAGTSYRVLITLYGASEIKVQTTLEAWKESEDVIPVNPSEF